MPEILPKSALRWLPDYAVGVKEIDEEHQALFALTEKLHQALFAGKAQEILESILEELVAYTCCHFAHEEHLMEQIRYPYYQDHCRQHQDLKSQVKEMKEASPAGEATPAKLMQFLLDWLKIHTTTSDRRIGSYMRKCGLIP